MKKLLLLLLVFTTLPLFAQKSLEIAYESSDYLYREPAMSHAMSLKGRLRGGSLRYETRMQESDIFAALEGRWMGGTTDYNGWIQSSNPSIPPEKHSVGDIGDYYYEMRLLLGPTYDLSDEMKLWVGSGLGYRHLKDHLNKDSSYGYLRESTYVYWPITGSLRYETAHSMLALNGEFDLLIFGKQMSHVSRLGFPDNVRNDQQKGFGVRFGLKLQTNLWKETGVFIEPFYRYWQIAESEMTYGFIEPYNTTEEYGVRIGVTFYLGSNSEIYSL